MSLPAEDIHRRPAMSDALAQRLVERAVGEACASGFRLTIVVADESGIVKALRRMDGASLMSLQTALDKAHTAVASGMATDVFFALLHGSPDLLAGIPPRPGIAAFGGGVPLIRDGEVCGALAVSGGTADEDRQIAERVVCAFADTTR